MLEVDIFGFVHRDLKPGNMRDHGETHMACCPFCGGSGFVAVQPLINALTAAGFGVL